MKNLTVIGAGAWGTALAAVGAQAGMTTRLWAREEEVVDSINHSQENTSFLKGHKLPPELTATNSMSVAGDADLVFLVSPAQHLRATAETLKAHIRSGTPIAICSKGIEAASGKLMSEVLEETLPKCPPMVLSGPTFAAEVADGLPCALTMAVEDKTVADEVMAALALPTFRLYHSTDVIGAQIGGAIKNVLAIATGVVAGLGLGENARAAVITRGLAEIMRFGDIFGARRETLMGLSGLGDLILTCSSTQSRNMSLGVALGSGETLKDIMARRKTVSEGVHTTDIVYRIAQDKGIHMPITEAVYEIVHGGADVAEALGNLLSRPYTSELD